MAELSTLTVEVKAKGVAQTAKELDKLAAEAEKAEEAVESLGEEYDQGRVTGKNYAAQTKKLTDQFKLEAKSVGKTKDEIKILKLEQSGASKAQVDAAKAALRYKDALLSQAKAADIAEQEQEELANASNVVKGNFRGQRNSMQMVSYQLQDVAVQAQMGTSAFTILGQQGPQLASAFGPGGAVLGAFIAFGAILGGLAFKMLSAGKSSKDLAESVRGLGLEFNLLNEAQQQLIRTQNELQIKALTAENEKLAAATVTTTGKLGLAAAMSGEAASSFDDMNGAMNRNSVQISTNNVKIKELTDENAGLSKSTQSVIDRLDEESVSIGLNARELDLNNAIRAKAAPEQILEINRLHDLIDLKNKEVKAREDNATKLKKEAEAREQAIETAEKAATARLKKALDASVSQTERLQTKLANDLALLEQDRIAAVAAAELKGQDILEVEEAYYAARANLAAVAATQISDLEIAQAKKTASEKASLEQMALTRASAVAGQLASAMNDAFGEQSAAAKAAFLLQQGLAMAQIVVSTEVAAAAAAANSAILTGLPGFLATAAAIRAMGAISLGIVAGQTIGGLARATGGQVRGGESYLVGERGPELLTMGGAGRVSSNDQLKQAIGGGGESVQIVNNVDARGAGPDVEMKIRTAMMQTSQQTIATIQDLMRRRRFV